MLFHIPGVIEERGFHKRSESTIVAEPVTIGLKGTETYREQSP